MKRCKCYRKDVSLTDWYAKVIRGRKETLCSISKYLVADAWFSKKPFVDQVIDMGMHLRSRLRDNADLKYLYRGQLSGGKGRPKKNNGKIDTTNIRTDYFELVAHFCTDAQMDATEILEYIS